MSTQSQVAPYRELTPASLILGVAIGAVMTAAFVYIGLKLGFGLAGSSVAAILGFAILRGSGKLLGNAQMGSIVETNITQTIASGINTASSGVVFTFPALLLLGYKFTGDDMSFGDTLTKVAPVLLAATAGSFMGIVVIIPLRKQLLEVERLRFPTGVAVGTILKAPGAGAKKALTLGAGVLAGAIFTILSNEKVGLLPESLDIGHWLLDGFGVAEQGAVGIALLGTTLSLSMANFGAGMLSGKGGLPFALGGALAWWIVAPLAIGQGWGPDLSGVPADKIGDAMWGHTYGTMLRPLGIGLLIGGALMGVIMSFPALKSAVQSLSAAAKLSKDGETMAEELSPKVLALGLAGAAAALFFVAYLGSGSLGASLTMAIVGTLWLGLAGLIVAQATGATDISPLSGLALIAVTIMLGITFLFDLPKETAIFLAVTIGVAVCIANNQCADMMSDLKTGHLIGGIPRRQQIAQFMVAWIGPTIAIGTVLLLWAGGEGGTGGFGPESAACLEGSGCLPAPQAGVLEGMINGVMDGNAPVDKYFAGAGLGIGLGLVPIGGLGVLVGLAFYLPFEITFGYGLGCLATMAFEKFKGRKYIGDVIIPLAAGLIVGEALTNLTLTMIALASGGQS